MEEKLEVVILKLVTGEEVIGTILEYGADTITIEKIFFIGVDQQQQRLVFAPFMAYTEQTPVSFSHDHILVKASPVASLYNDYMATLEQLGLSSKPKIFMPGKKPILTPVN